MNQPRNPSLELFPYWKVHAQVISPTESWEMKSDMEMSYKLSSTHLANAIVAAVGSISFTEMITSMISCLNALGSTKWRWIIHSHTRNIWLILLHKSKWPSGTFHSKAPVGINIAKGLNLHDSTHAIHLLLIKKLKLNISVPVTTSIIKCIDWIWVSRQLQVIWDIL